MTTQPNGYEPTQEIIMTVENFTNLPEWQLSVLGPDGHTVAPKDGDKPVWSGRVYHEPPQIGERIRVRMNGLGHATVTGYFVEGGYLGVRVKYEAPCGDVEGYVFGAEITLPDPVQAPAKKLVDYHRAVVEAQAALTKARHERARNLVEHSPRKIGDVFDASGLTWKVEKITASEGGSEVYVFCRKLMKNKNWSISTTPHVFKIEGWEEVVALNHEIRDREMRKPLVVN